jgi:hypothetical protein
VVRKRFKGTARGFRMPEDVLGIFSENFQSLRAVMLTEASH